MSPSRNSRTPMPRLIGLIALTLAAYLLPVTPQPVAAQDALAHRSYISPFPNGDRYRVVVLGDGLGEALWNGLYRTFEDNPSVDVLQQSKKWTGFTDPKRFDWNTQIDQIMKAVDLLARNNRHLEIKHPLAKAQFVS